MISNRQMMCVVRVECHSQSHFSDHCLCLLAVELYIYIYISSKLLLLRIPSTLKIFVSAENNNTGLTISLLAYRENIPFTNNI